MISYILISSIILILGFSFVAFEIAYLSCTYPIIFENTKNKIFIENPAGILFTILLGVNLLAISYAIISFEFFKKILPLESAIVFSGIFSTVNFVFFSEYIPRFFARRHPEIILRYFKGLISLSYYIVYPINYLIGKLLPRKPEGILEFYLDELERSKIIDSSQKSLIQKSMKLIDMPASLVVKPYSEFDIIDIEKFKLTNYKSDIIVIKKENDILGFIYKKDLLKLEDMDLKDIIRKPVFLEKNKSIYDAINLMKERKTSVIFTNEGILTIEDIWESVSVAISSFSK
ncbi:MAG: CNNM domain-containing protein [candidate division WOR-3 bacterium]|nr:CNNM domain-containing protein [candidate division WOR-3 bacterium]MCX7947785.1 CNNM domain-containing protein [candidate division WOR-3 bacterium]MDW8150742.1 CNNM domain-containing protein [candidate division WOR-3 bacterium]